MTFDAFISYSQHDKDFAKWLQRALERYPLKSADGTRRSLKLFRDETDLGGSGDLSDALRRALHNSAFLLVVCSTSAAQSRWVNLEIDEFLKAHDQGQVIPLYINGAPYCQDRTSECVPQVLRDSRRGHAYVIDATTAANKKSTVLRVLAALTGQPLDAFVQRHRRRMFAQTTRLAALVVLALGMGLTALTAGVELNRRNRALTQADQSEGYERVRLILEGSVRPHRAV